MVALRTFPWPSWALFVFFVVGPVAAQNSIPASQLPQDTQPSTSSSTTVKPIAFDEFLDSVVRQERRLEDVMRTFKPIIETYIQEEGSQLRFQKGVTPNGDDYFLGRLDLSGEPPSIVPFADEETWNQGGEKYFVQDPLPFSQLAFSQALFPDLGKFDRQHYSFEFVRWEVLGEVRCAAIDVKPNDNAQNRGFVGRIWVEDQEYGIVRFKGTFTTKGFARRAYHFDSWRLNTFGTWWMPAYFYTEESRPHDVANNKLWFKAQTRVWGYDLRNANDHPENSKRAADNTAQPKEASKEPNSPPSDDGTATRPEDIVVERAQAAGLMASDGDVDRILETVVNNLLVTNDLDIAGIRCRVLLTAPLESFAIGRTIVLSRGLLDVLPDEATLAAVLAHEVAHIVLGHAISDAYLKGFAWPFPDSQIFPALDFHFRRAQEKDANKKARELFSKSPYKDQWASVHLFSQALDDNFARFPNLLEGRFCNDFGSGRLAGMKPQGDSPKTPKIGGLNQLSALPIGSRITVDPWSDRIEMLKSKPVRLMSPAEKIPFEVTPFYPHLKRLDAAEKPSGARE